MAFFSPGVAKYKLMLIGGGVGFSGREPAPIL